MELREIQADALEEIAAEKAREACRRLDGPAMVEDTGLFIHHLHGFPGPYSAYVFRTLGNQGVLRLLRDVTDRGATFQSVFAYCQPDGAPECFPSAVPGVIASECRGEGWGYDPIFVAEGASGRTYGELGDDKNQLSPPPCGAGEPCPLDSQPRKLDLNRRTVQEAHLDQECRAPSGLVQATSSETECLSVSGPFRVAARPATLRPFAPRRRLKGRCSSATSWHPPGIADPAWSS